MPAGTCRVREGLQEGKVRGRVGFFALAQGLSLLCGGWRRGVRREEVAFESDSQCNNRVGAERGAGGDSHPQHPVACEETWYASDQRISKGGIRNGMV